MRHTQPLKLTRYSSVKEEQVDWLWPARIARGKVNLLVGAPGLGKSWVTMYLAARISRGQPWPDGAETGQPGRVLILNAEDGLADTLKPRLRLLGADTDNCIAIEGRRQNIGGSADQVVPLNLRQDHQHVRTAVAETSATAFFIDPLTAYLPGVDMHRDNDVRTVLAWYATLAQELKVAVVCVMHLNKNTTQTGLDRVGGSVAFGALARTVTGVVKDPDDPERRLLVSLKNNLTKQPPALAFTLGDHGLAWDTTPVPADVVARALQPGPGHHEGDGRTAGQAEALIREFLGDGEPHPASTLYDEGRTRGISDRTLRRIASRLGVEMRFTGFGKDKTSVWQWPLRAGEGRDRDGTGHAGHPPTLASMASMDSGDPDGSPSTSN